MEGLGTERLPLTLLHELNRIAMTQRRPAAAADYRNVAQRGGSLSCAVGSDCSFAGLDHGFLQTATV
jgi:hypothetical protein